MVANEAVCNCNIMSKNAELINKEYCFFIHQAEPKLLIRCNVSANRMQSDESLLSRAMLRCSLTSRSKDTTPSPGNLIFRFLISQLESFPHP